MGHRIALVAALSALALAPAAHAASLPVLGTETPAGTGKLVELKKAKPAAKTLDGRIGDWTGTPAGFSGPIVRSRGELVYTDHLFDAYGADDGHDAEYLRQTGPLTDAVPEAYRLGAILQNDPAGEFGVPAPDQVRYHTNYGDLEMQDRADLSEVRVSADRDNLWLLARTSTMTSSSDTALLVLLDTAPGDTERTVPFGSGLKTKKAELALQLTGSTGKLVDLRTGATSELPAGSVATRPDGWDNAIEARIPLKAGTVGVAVAASKPGGPIANVAFRTAEPVREWFDKQQALDLLAGSIDRFFATADLDALRAGANERFEPTAGYFERDFRSTDEISAESGENGILQPYGVFLPTGYDAAKATPLQLWLHWRGGSAHAAANVDPGIFRDMGERQHTMVVSPRGRGSSSWYVGRGQVDLEQVWADVHQRFDVDRARTYVAGHSMGGYGTYLMTTTHPDWFAAALPASGAVTQGAWTGLDFPGCDDYHYDDYSPCYIQANSGDARAQHTRKLVTNLRNIPIAVYQGTEDELVPSSGVVRQVEPLVEAGYRHRLYMFHTQEHYGPPIWDQWAEGADYMHTFVRPAVPAQIVHVRDMPFERAVERVNSGGAKLDFDFGHDAWLKHLEPVDATGGQASFDGTTAAAPEQPHLLQPEAGGPAGTDQAGPYTMTGLAWLADPINAAPKPANTFTAKLTGARAATLDLDEMGMKPGQPVTGTVTADHAVELTLRRGVSSMTIEVPAGTKTIAVSAKKL
jgi:pimeloyl-ACP methyl ester carboxylesterase